ncbi:MAG: hypothetical protein KGZ87_01275 [Bacteroidetes bacterium]|nr:hypothetical protein [Bacteroidota bacterium]
MSFLKKLEQLFNIRIKSSEEKEIEEQPVNLSLDDFFVHNFINNGGKFLYCSSKQEALNNLHQIIKENQWYTITCFDNSLVDFSKVLPVTFNNQISAAIPFLTKCEQLISENGSILFSSNQLKEFKLADFSNHFIVYAKTSQIVNSTSDGLCGINNRNKGNLPTNIGAIKNFTPMQTDNFLNYGYTNSKNLYLLLVEDL